MILCFGDAEARRSFPLSKLPSRHDPLIVGAGLGGGSRPAGVGVIDEFPCLALLRMGCDNSTLTARETFNAHPSPTMHAVQMLIPGRTEWTR